MGHEWVKIEGGWMMIELLDPFIVLISTIIVDGCLQQGFCLFPIQRIPIKVAPRQCYTLVGYQIGKCMSNHTSGGAWTPLLKVNEPSVYGHPCIATAGAGQNVLHQVYQPATCWHPYGNYKWWTFPSPLPNPRSIGAVWNDQTTREGLVFVILMPNFCNTIWGQRRYFVFLDYIIKREISVDMHATHRCKCFLSLFAVLVLKVLMDCGRSWGQLPFSLSDNNSSRRSSG